MVTLSCHSCRPPCPATADASLPDKGAMEAPSPLYGVPAASLPARFSSACKDHSPVSAIQMPFD